MADFLDVAGEEIPQADHLETRRKLWRAPEILRNPLALPRGSQKGDVYSFGILLYEIIGRIGPWGHTHLSDKGEFCIKNFVGFRC